MKIRRLLSEKRSAIGAPMRSAPSSSLAPWAKTLTGVALVALISGCTEDIERQHSESRPPNYAPPPPPHEPVTPANAAPPPGRSSHPHPHPHTLPADWAAAKWGVDHAGDKLTLANYQTVFHDDFSDCGDITKETFQSQDYGFKWYAEDGGMGGYNIGTFVTPQTAAQKGYPNPIDCSQGHLTLTISNPSRTPKGWQGAQIKTRSYGGAGFMQTYGYWEVDAMFPPLPAGFVPWASVWIRDRLVTYPTPQTNELDFFESGLMSPTDGSQLTTTIHRFPSNPPAAKDNPDLGVITAHHQLINKWSFNIFDGRRHKYGLKRTHDWQIVYIDRVEKFRFPMTGDDMRTNVVLLIDNAMNFQPTAPMSTTYSMHVYSADIYACSKAGCN